MNTVRDYVDGLFAKYPHSSDMADFKEEICVNLQERIDYLIKNGADAEAAFAKATAELGDVSAIADQLSADKHREVLEEMYMGNRKYLGKKHIIGYTLAGGVMLFGIITSLIGYWATDRAMVGVSGLLPFFLVPVCAFVFLGLTQETASSYPMKWKRASLYTLAVGLILFGFISMFLAFFATGQLYAAAGTLIPFVIPGVAGLALLIMTEKRRHKPWVAEQEAIWAQHMMERYSDPHLSTRFGLYSGALWVLAIALFLALGFAMGFQYSWLVFIFAVAAQVFIQAQMTTKK